MKRPVASPRATLASGEDTSDESREDIRAIFAVEFTKIRNNNHMLPLDWPGTAAIEEMSVYAAGSFIWADVVAEYLGATIGRADPIERLKDVLSDIRLQSENQRSRTRNIDGLDRVDLLYARIVFEAFRRYSTADQLKMPKRILAAVVLAKDPLRKGDLVELLSAGASDARDVLASAESTLRDLALSSLFLSTPTTSYESTTKRTQTSCYCRAAASQHWRVLQRIQVGRHRCLMIQSPTFIHSS